jgi:GrpB-like predicted nucleotidyltransferase (UPF0157 family)
MDRPEPEQRAAEDPPRSGELRRAIHEPVRIAPPDPAWPHRYEEERARIVAIGGPRILALEHVGSTAVADLPAKPILDIMAGVDHVDVADDLLPDLCADGWITSAAYDRMLGDRRWLMRQSGGRRTHHLHLVVHEGPRWRDVIRFRDSLLADPDLAAAYTALKQRCAAEHPHDREDYTRAKDGFVAEVLRGTS